MVGVGGRIEVPLEQLEFAAYLLTSMFHSDPNLAGQIMQADETLEDVDVRKLAFVRKLSDFRHVISGGANQTLMLLRASIRETAPGYLETLILARDFQCSDARDKVHALFNLAKDKTGLRFKSDYSKDMKATYMDFVSAWIEQHGTLDILGAVEAQPASRDLYRTAPSWCPDWSVPASSSCLVRRERIPTRFMSAVDDLDGALYSADGGMKRTDSTVDIPLFELKDDILHVTGIILDRISFFLEAPGEVPAGMAFPPCDPPSYYRAMMWTKAFYLHYKSKTPETGTKNPYPDAFRAALAMFHGDLPSSWPPRDENPANCDPHEPSEPYVCIPNSNHSGQPTPNQSRHVLSYGGSYDRTAAWDVVRTVLRGRRPFVTENGYMGLAPEYLIDAETPTRTEPWLLAILAGCSVPLVLRENEDGTYAAVGTAFVQGWMEGEVLVKEMGVDTPAEFWEALAGAEKLKIV
ncbi:hypothetical protein BAUCODRAFT_75181 [Baudoinia panamericana UAMH 10762]|uniref:Heterokaryon incompatibility domain-containing protein n=1 Tax=Baudoinia panamericana (strain UAMH 10762) TaxID=717646 RepID=M2N557_BAUPA|nr:uncharacterized protein BAUCODRAFT_75181 [Baudoinia panamericana UAMH 10762]EMC93900.1 hypothetical protein BAUCODRAFT_75181 [Baudoinia panamericana UAMH 10762]